MTRQRDPGGAEATSIERGRSVQVVGMGFNRSETEGARTICGTLSSADTLPPIEEFGISKYFVSGQSPAVAPRAEFPDAEAGGVMARDTLILGAGGMLGASWRDARPDAVAMDRAALDLTEPDHLERIPPDAAVVVNCAAYTDVDGAEEAEGLATELNGAAVARLAARCREIGALLVHYSTDYVFDGSAGAPYAVDHERNPIGAYGRSKLAGEIALEASGAEFLCIRTSWLYAAHGKNFVRTIARLCAERDELKVVADQRGRPTNADHLVALSRKLIDAGARGFFHGCDSGECTWHELATAIGERINPGCAIHPCSTEEFPRPAPRPSYSVMDLGATEEITGPLPHWREGLAAALDRMETMAPDAPRKAV